MRFHALTWLLLPLFQLFHLAFSQSLAQNLRTLADEIESADYGVLDVQDFNHFDLTCSDNDIFVRAS